jgi:hypothetical protein
MGEVKKYFLNQFHDLENQLKIAICGIGALAGLNLNFPEFDWLAFINFFKFIFGKLQF